MSETKKRPPPDDEEQFRPRKRAVSDDYDPSTRLNGAASPADEPKNSSDVERFRKVAIYRRMKHYSRAHERSEARVAELERQKNTCEAGLAALEACWTQIIGAIRLMLKPQDLPNGVKPEDLYDLTKHVSDDSDVSYVKALRQRMHETSELVEAFVRLGGQGQVVPVEDEMYQICQKVQTESAAVRSEFYLMRTQLRDMKFERDKYREDLEAAERRLDRLQSTTVATAEGKAVEAESKVESPLETPPSPAQAVPVVNGFHGVDAEQWKEIAKVRETQILQLSRENEDLRSEIRQLKFELSGPSEQFVTKTHYYKILFDVSKQLSDTVQEQEAQITKLEAEVEQLQKSRLEMQDTTAAACQQAMSELKGLVARRDQEIARLREQRDQQLSELNERKQKDQIKLRSIQEYKALVDSRSERLKAMSSEITRLRARLAVNAGDEDLMSFFFRTHSDKVEDVSKYVDDLRTRLSALESRTAAMETALTHVDQDHPHIAEHIKAEAEAREQQLQAQKELERFRSIFGGSADSVSPDTSKLVEQLQVKEDEIQTLRLQVQQHDQASSALYMELDKLSAAWEALDRQVKGKIDDLSAMEERLARSALEKAKSDNKYYSAMRDKEAVETERKNLARNVEKQAKALERLVESEKVLKARLDNTVGEIMNWKIVASKYMYTNKNKEKEVEEQRQRAEGELVRADKLRIAVRDLERAVDRRSAQVRLREEETARLMKEAEQYAAKMKALARTQSASSSGREAQLQSEVDKCMSILKCSTCKQNMRDTVITKCMHSFCKSCVESRIATRQRKCPACNLPFSQGEVQSLYFQ